MNEFELFISQLKQTNNTLDSFSDFGKARYNTNKLRIKLNQLNYLIGQADMNGAIRELYDENPNCFDALSALIAVRTDDNKLSIDRAGNVVPIQDYTKSVERVIEFVEDTGLIKVFQNPDVSNLVDYVFGVEVGLDSNSRKNRGGLAMVRLVEQIFKANNIEYKQEVYANKYPEIASLGYDSKRFDFVVETKYRTYLIETNFYNANGSKMNEVARAYIELSPKINRYRNFAFVWITDGQGWLKAKKQLQEAFDAIPNLYNLTNITKLINQIQITDTFEI